MQQNFLPTEGDYEILKTPQNTLETLKRKSLETDTSVIKKRLTACEHQELNFENQRHSIESDLDETILSCFTIAKKVNGGLNNYSSSKGIDNFNKHNDAYNYIYYGFKNKQ